MILYKKKYSFALLEVIIAIAVCMMTFGLLFTNTSKHVHKKLKLLKQIEAERLLELSRFEILSSWIQGGTFENPALEFPPSQTTVFSDEPITLKREIKLWKTTSKTSDKEEEYKKLTFQITYPELSIRNRYNLLLKLVDKKSD